VGKGATEATEEGCVVEYKPFGDQHDRKWLRVLTTKAEWLAAYLHGLTMFPNGKHDDQADSTS